MKLKSFVTLFASISISLLVSCSQHKASEQRSYDLAAILYHRHTAETKALQYQAFNVAKDALSKLKKQALGKKNLAVVLDIDETILDNSPYQVQINKKDEMYPTGWNEWTGKGVAEPIPGAKEFIQYAKNENVEVILITNRTEEEKNGTVKNLHEKGFAVDVDKILYKKDSSSKEVRRLEVLKKYNVLLLIGDNLADFDVLYDQRTYDNRNQATDQLAQSFGRKYIMLPNPMYGDWEGALYNWKFPKSSSEKEEMLKNILKNKN
jgi:5'-nucleotidase (lipoprotein e(P4) family)